MGIISMLRDEKRAIKQTYENSLRDPPAWLTSQSDVSSGLVVNEATAIRSMAVYACIRIISESLAMLPLKVHQKQDDGARVAEEHRAHWLLSRQPNPYMTAMVFREALTSHALLTGNAYALIEYDRAWRLKYLWLLRPDLVRVEKRDNALVYFAQSETTGVEEELKQWEVMHIPGLGYDGVSGYSPIRLAAEAIGVSLAAEQFAGKFFGSGAHAGLVLEHPKQLSDVAYERLKKRVDTDHAGVTKSHRTMILEEGMKATRVTIPPNEAQFLETRKFQLGDIARLYRMQLHKLQDLDKATFSNIEQQSIEHVTDTLLPWAVRIEQEADRKLFSPVEQKTYYSKHNFSGLLRGDLKSQADALAVGRQWGWLSPNDCRKFLDLNPIPEEFGGDDYLTPVNMTALGPREEEEDDSPVTPVPPSPVPPPPAPLPIDEPTATDEESPTASTEDGERFLGLLVSIAERAARRQFKAARGNGRTTEERFLWLKQFAEGQADYVADQIFPVLAALPGHWDPSARPKDQIIAREIGEFWRAEMMGELSPEIIERFARRALAHALARHADGKEV